MSALLAVVLLFLPAVASGQGATEPLVPIGGEFQVDSYTEGPQRSPAVAIGPDGEFLVVWHSGDSVTTGPDGSLSSVQAQLFARDGAPVGGEFQVNSLTEGRQENPSLAHLADGGFVVVWASKPESETSIQAQILSATGAPVGGEFQVSLTTATSLQTPAVSATPTGDFVVVWSRAGIRGQRFTSTGSSIGDELLITGDLSAGAPSVTHSHTGEFLVTWAESADDVVKARQFDTAGDPIGSEFQVDSGMTTDSKSDTAAAIQPNGDFVVVWSEFVDSLYSPVKARRFTATALPLGDEFLVGNDTLGAGDSHVAGFDSGDFLVTWSGCFPLEIFGRYFLDSGLPAGDDFFVNTFEFGIKSNPYAAVGEHNDVIVTWQSTQVGSPGIFAQRYGLDTDQDGFVDLFDNCPEIFNPDQLDDDNDGSGNPCDLCPGFDDSLDEDGDGVPDGCDICLGDDATGDSDGDGVCDDIDLCFGDDSSGDADGDGYCADVDCDDSDPTNTSPACTVFVDGFESGDTSMWSSTAF